MYRSRYRRIVFFFARVLISLAWWDLLLPRLGMKALSHRTRPDRLRRSAVAFRSLAIEMGGVLIKVGQFLSTRVDVLPPEFTHELAGLQDEVPPASYESIRQVAEAEYGMPLQAKFAFFDPQPLAAASLGQVHRAQIQLNVQAGEPPQLREVVVKIQRPHIDKIIEIDLSALRTVGRWLQRYRPIRRRADVPALLAEFTRILYQEIDYLAEGRNAETFSANFAGDPCVKVPQVIWSHTTTRALTLENVWSIKIADYDSISSAGIDRSKVASRLLNTYLKQIFEDGFFHADPHPGNLFVAPVPAGQTGCEPGGEPDWQLTFIDFGMVGHVPSNLREGLRELLIGVGTRDSARVVRAYQLLGVLLPSADLALIERAEARVFERFWGMNMSELTAISTSEILEFADEFRDLVYTLPFQVPHDLIFLARAVSILSGMCTGLDPQFNLWDHLAPYAQKLIAEEARAGAESWFAELGTLARSFLSVPRKMDTILDRMERGQIAVRSPELTEQFHRLDKSVRQVAGGLIFTGLLLGGIQLYLAGEVVFGEVLLGGAGVSLVWVILAGRLRS